MNFSKSINQFRINPKKFKIPIYDEPGDFIDGFTSRRRFCLRSFLLILIPFIGNIIFIIYVLYWIIRLVCPFHVFLFYRNGIIVQDYGFFSSLKEEGYYDYETFIGLKSPTCKYVRYINGIKIVTYSTEIYFVSSSFEDYFVGQFNYKFKNAFPNVIIPIINAFWRPMLVKKYDDELQKTGHVTFYEDRTPLIINSNYIQQGKRRISAPFTYHLENGVLHIHSENDSQKFDIFYNDVTNKDLFAEYLKRIMGIEL